MTNNIIIVGDFNSPLTPMERSSRQKIKTERKALNDTLQQLDLVDIYRAYQLKAAECTFLSSAHGTFSKIDHMLVQKSHLSKFKNNEIISSFFSDHNAMTLEIN